MSDLVSAMREKGSDLLIANAEQSYTIFRRAGFGCVLAT